MTSQQTVNENKSKVVQVPLNLPFDNNSSPDSNVIEIQEMHVHKPKYSRETLLPKIAQKNLSPCTKKLHAKREKNYKSGKPVFLSNIFSLKENKEKQVEAEPTNIESKDI